MTRFHRYCWAAVALCAASSVANLAHGQAGAIIGQTKVDTEKNSAAIAAGQQKVDPTATESNAEKAAAMPAAPLVDASTALRAGDLGAARSAYQSTLSGAPTPDAKQQLSLDWADSLSVASRLRSGDKSFQTQVETEYRTLLTSQAPDVRRLAGNNLGVMLSRNGQNEQALAALRQVELDYAAAETGPAKAAYYYNLGQAFERSGQRLQAIDRYRISAVADPEFRPALSAILRNAVLLPPNQDSFTLLGRWIAIALERRQYDLAGRALKAAFSNPEGASYLTGGPMVGLLLRYLAVEPMNADGYQEEWGSLIAAASKRNAKLEGIRQECWRVYAGNYDVHIESYGFGSARQYFTATLNEPLGGDRKNVVARFVSAVGDTLATEERYDAAFQRYATAWSVDTNDFEAVLSMANLLVEHGTQIDPSGQMLDELVRGLFQGKMQAYRSDDWEKIFSFHTVLGSIYTRERQWGSSGKIDSAIFQLEHAIKAHQELEKSGKSQVHAIPLLWRDLATAYREMHQFNEAYTAFLNASEDALKDSNKSLASLTLDNAAQIQAQAAATQSQVTRYQDLRGQL